MTTRDKIKEIEYATKYITLDPNDLCCKWGFGDGDYIADYLNYYYFELFRNIDVDYHKLLFILIKTYVLPNITESIAGLELMVTIHNPVRVQSVNGVQVDWTDIDTRYITSIEAVQIPMQTLFDIVEHMQSNNSPYNDKYFQS